MHVGEAPSTQKTDHGRAEGPELGRSLGRLRNGKEARVIGAEPGEGLVGKEFQSGAGGQSRQVLVCHCATVRT